MAKTDILRSNTVLISISVLVILISLFSLYAVFLPVIGLLPGMIAMVVDPYQKKYASKIVFSYNLLAVLQYLIPIFSIGIGKNADDAAYSIVSNPKTWLIIYLSAGFGWFVYLVIPKIFTGIARIQNQITIRKLQSELELIVKEWGSQLIDQNSVIINKNSDEEVKDIKVPKIYS
jgi:hypothetical protein